MRDLKPKLMLSRSGRRRGSRGPFGSIIMLVIVFLLGFYAGGKYNGIDGLLGRAEKSIGIGTVDSGQAESTEPAAGNPPVHERDIIAERESAESSKAESSLNDGNADDGTLQISEYQVIGSVSPEALEGNTVDADRRISITGESDKPDGEPAARDADTDVIPEMYTLQVAAFVDEDEAREVAGVYKDKGYDAYNIRLQNSKGEVWNLVRIGKYDTNEQAIYNAELFKNQEGKQPLIQTYYKNSNVESAN